MAHNGRDVHIYTERKRERDLNEASQDQDEKAGKQDWSKEAEVFSFLSSPEGVPSQC